MSRTMDATTLTPPVEGTRTVAGTRTVEGTRTVDLTRTAGPSTDVCWRMLTAQVPLTLLLDLALPSSAELAELYDELLHEPGSSSWLQAPG